MSFFFCSRRMICSSRCTFRCVSRNWLPISRCLSGEGTGIITFLIFPTESIAPAGSDLIWLIVLGSVLTVIPFFLQLHALKRLSAFTVNLTYNLEPLYSILFAAVIFGETREVGPSFWAGITLIVISVLIQTWRVRRSSAE